MNRGPSRRAAAIAIGAAIVALVISVIAVFVVANRGGDTKLAPVATPSESDAQTVPAVEVVKLVADAVAVARDAGKVVGVKVIDDKLRKKLGLEPGDVITAVSGRPVKRELDVYESIVGLSMIDTKELFVEIVRNKQARLVRWRLEIGRAHV